MEAWAVRYLSQLPLFFLPPAFSGPPACCFFVGNCSENNNLDHSLLFTQALNCPRQLPSLACSPTACLPACLPVVFCWELFQVLVCPPSSLSKRRVPTGIMLSPWYKMAMWILVPISLLFWSSNPVFWSKLSLISQSSEFIPSHFTNVIEHLTQIPFKLGSYGLFSWLSSHLEEFLPPMESVTTETPSSDLVNPSPLRQIPESNTEAPFTWDHSLWLLTGAMVMALDAYFPPPFTSGLPWEAPSSGYPSLALDGILVVGPIRMGARLC
ncbi:hypothetical protein DSO57_1015471 [Entomophthora muscae]|uniref:Uncharacterized protein n=1 Tax=Entomophthora muscae TaxID=34485 RepID=A0ACC2SU09_9FUNG|nr:hypothetical protein DSO57_1015471 [Entomophthora muscae]